MCHLYFIYTPVTFLIHILWLAMFENTVGAPVVLHPMAYETRPTCCPLSFLTKGPPESPLHDMPLSADAHIILEIKTSFTLLKTFKLDFLLKVLSYIHINLIL